MAWRGYEADVLPENDGWEIVQTSGDITKQITGGAFVVTGDVGGILRYDKKTFISPTATLGLQFQIRAKKTLTTIGHNSPGIEYIVNGLVEGSYQDYKISIGLTTSSGSYQMIVFKVGLADESDIQTVQIVGDVANWHTYRVEFLDNTPYAVINCYIDDFIVGTSVTALSFPTDIQSEYFRMIVDPIDNTDTIEIDNIRWLVFGLPASTMPGLGEDELIPSLVNTRVIYWEIPDPYLVDIDAIKFELQVDSANTFDTSNLRTYYYNSSTDNNIVSYQNGRLIKAFEVPIPFRQDSGELTYYYRVRATGAYTSAEWSTINSFVVDQKYEDSYAEDMFDNLADRNAYSKENKDSNIYQIMQMYGHEFDQTKLENLLTEYDMTIKECRNAQYQANFGRLVNFNKSDDFVWAEYREIVKVLIDAFLHGGTPYAIKKFVKILTGQDPYILEYRKDFSGWTLDYNYIHFPRSFVVGDTRSSECFSLTVTPGVVYTLGVATLGAANRWIVDSLEYTGIAGTSLLLSIIHPAGWYYIKWNGTAFALEPYSQDVAFGYSGVIWAVYWSGNAVMQTIDMRNIYNPEFGGGTSITYPSYNLFLTPPIKLYSGYEIDHGCEIHIGDPFQIFTNAIANPVTSTSTTINSIFTTSKFPSSGFLYIDGEIIKYSGSATTSFTGCTRGVNGTVAYPHNIGDTIVRGDYHELFVKFIELIKSANVKINYVYHSEAI